MRRVGPFFPLLVAAVGQTRLPLAADLVPSDDDTASAEAWSPLVGALVGLGLGFVAAILARLGIADVAAAALIASAWLFLGGGWAEVGVAGRLEKMLSRGSRASDAAPVALAFTITVVVSLLLRVTLLVSIEIGSWTAALIVSASCARFAPIVAKYMRKLAAIAKRELPPPPTAIVVATAIVVIGLPIAVGYAGLGAVVLALALGSAVAFSRLEVGAATLVWIVELGALVCLATSSTYPLFG